MRTSPKALQWRPPSTRRPVHACGICHRFSHPALHSALPKCWLAECPTSFIDGASNDNESLVQNPPLSHNVIDRDMLSNYRSIYQLYSHESTDFLLALEFAASRSISQRPIRSPLSNSSAWSIRLESIKRHCNGPTSRLLAYALRSVVTVPARSTSELYQRRSGIYHAQNVPYCPVCQSSGRSSSPSSSASLSQL